MNSAGINYINLTTDKQVNDFFNGDLDLEKYDIRPNDYIIVKHNGEVIAKLKYKNKSMERLPYITVGEKKDLFKPLNVEQECYFDLLNDDNVPIKVCIGIAGTGKTKSALKFGLKKLEKGEVEKILIVRNPVSVGEQLGFYKGDKDDKLKHWNNPARDNLKHDGMTSFEEMVDAGLIEMDIPADMLGRNLENTWVIVDECQQLTYEQTRMLGERVAKGSQIIFIGDLDQIFDKRFKDNNGLERLYNLRGHKLVGIVELKEDVRSEVSKLFATQF